MKLDELLAQVPLFRHLSPEHLEVVARAVTPVRFERGAVVVRAGEAMHRLLVVHEGSIRRFGAPADDPPLFTAGGVIGELASIEQRSFPWTLEASEPTSCYALDPKQFLAKLRTSPEICIVLLRTLANRIPETIASPTPNLEKSDDEKDDGAMIEVPDLVDANQLEIYAQEIRELYRREKLQVAELRSSLMGTVRALVSLAEAKDPALTGHGNRVARETQLIARVLGWKGQALTDAALGGLLHDVGNVAVDSLILRKTGALTQAERTIVQQHVEISARIIEQIEPLKQIVPYIFHHHERWDGQGYPSRLRGEAIPIEARLIAVADVYDTLLLNRPYRGARSEASAQAEIVDKAGSQFDPRIVEAFATVHREQQRPRSASSPI